MSNKQYRLERLKAGLEHKKADVKLAEAKSRRPVGRPRGPASFKWRDPQTGQPIPATVYYRRVKEVRRQAEQQARQKNLQAIQEMAKRGIPPQQAQQVIQQRQMPQANYPPQMQRPLTPEEIQRLMVQRQMQQQGQVNPNQLPNGTIIPMGNRIWKFQRGVVGEEGGLFGKVKKIYGSESSFWN